MKFQLACSLFKPTRTLIAKAIGRKRGRKQKEKQRDHHTLATDETYTTEGDEEITQQGGREQNNYKRSDTTTGIPLSYPHLRPQNQIRRPIDESHTRHITHNPSMPRIQETCSPNNTRERQTDGIAKCPVRERAE